MSTTRRKFTAEYKMKVVLAALKETQTLAELAAQHEVHPGVIQQWKKHFLERGASLFQEKSTKESGSKEEETNKLYEQIGRLQITHQN
jgi:transposase-like protein